jgi:hypothetical protein
MVKEVVVTDALTPEMVEAGADLLRQLDQANLPVKAAFWMHREESASWRLMLALPGVKTTGSGKYYSAILKILNAVKVIDCISQEKLLTPQVSLQNITVMDADDPLISVLKSAFNTGDEIATLRVPPLVLKGVPIDDLLIYRL